MASPYQWPWVDYVRVPTPNIDSTPTIIFGKQATCIIDRVLLCNKTDQDIYVDIWVKTERLIDDNFVEQDTFTRKKLFITKFGSVQALEESEVMESGDLMYANSDFSGNFFDCTISARLLLETAGVLNARNARN